MKPLIVVMILACATAASAAESPPSGTFETPPRYVYRPSVDDYYPASSRSMSEQGTTRIRLCFDTAGAKTLVAVDESSGSRRLDEAAMRWGLDVRIRPGTFRGLPLASCAKIPVVFSLEASREPADEREEQLELDIQAPPIIRDIQLPPPPPGRFIPLSGEGR